MRGPLGACMLAAVLVFQVVVPGRGEESGGGGGGGLLDPKGLEKFVDELPDMPRLRGYGVAEGGGLVAGNLTIGMYDITWGKKPSSLEFFVDCYSIYICILQSPLLSIWSMALENKIV